MRRRVILLGIAVALVSVNGCGSGTSPRTTTGGSSERAGHTLNSSPSGATSESNLPAPIAGPSTFFSVPTTSLSEMSVYSWDGVVIDRSTAAVPLECCAVDQSPDGSRIWAATSTGTVLLDRLGSLLQANFAGGTWSDDDVHLCEVQQDAPASRQGTLYVLGPDTESRRVVAVTGFGPHEATGVVICDTSDNFALLATSFMGGIETLTKVRLSDGATLWTQTASSSSSPCAAPNVISPDGVFEATGSMTSGYVCDLATGAVVGHIQGEPLAISWAGHTIIQVLSSPPNSFSLEAVDWQTGGVLWRTQSAAEQAGLVPEVQVQDEPNGDAIALTTDPNPGADMSNDRAELWLIRPGYPDLELSDQAEPGVL